MSCVASNVRSVVLKSNDGGMHGVVIHLARWGDRQPIFRSRRAAMMMMHHAVM